MSGEVTPAEDECVVPDEADTAEDDATDWLCELPAVEVLPTEGLTLDEACCVAILPPPVVAEDAGVAVDEDGSAVEY